MPKPFADDKKIAAAINATYADRNLHLTIPSRDGGCEGAAFDILKTGQDVLRQAAKDNNLKPLKPGDKRLLQLVFDKLRFSSTKAMTRWNVRTPQTIRDHNSTRYGRDLMTYEGDDSWEWLTMSVCCVASLLTLYLRLLLASTQNDTHSPLYMDACRIVRPPELRAAGFLGHLSSKPSIQP